MKKVNHFEKDDKSLAKPTAAGNWMAKIEVLLSKPDFSSIKKLEIDGHFKSEDPRYCYGFNEHDAPNHWVFRLDFAHFDFEIDVPYSVGSGGFGALLVRGGSEMLGGGFVVKGVMRITDKDPDKGILNGELTKVKTEGWRPDGEPMSPAYAAKISFRTVSEKGRI
ncbi:MAG: hypothetical protein ABWY46_10770 [Pseudomonas sp.]